MPKECKEYDCRDVKWLIETEWINERWVVRKAMEIGRDYDILIGKKNGNSSGIRSESQEGLSDGT